MALAWDWNWLTIVGILSALAVLAVYTGMKKVGDKNKTKAMWAFGILAVFLVGTGINGGIPDFIGLKGSSGAQTLTVADVQQAQSEGASGNVVFSNCPTTLQTTVKVSYEDPYASSLTYLAANWFYDSDTQFTNTSSSSTSPGYGSNSVTATCGETADIIVPTSTGSYSGTEKRGVKIEGQLAQVDVQGAELDTAYIRVLDITTDTYLNLFPDGVATGTNSTAFSKLNQTYVFSSVAAADNAVGQDGYLDLQIEIKANNSNKFLGEPNKKIWLTTDVGTDVEWQEPDVSFAGNQLSDRIGEIDSVSRSGSLVSAADYAYVLTNNGLDFGDTLKKIQYKIQAASGQNPDTSNDDVTVCFLAEGSYLSNNDVKTFKTGIYTDASTKTLVVYPKSSIPTPCFVLQIS